MPWTRLQIRSDPDPDNAQPWYEFATDEAGRSVEITADKDGGTEFDMVATAIDFSAVNPSDPFRLAITQDGNLITYQVGEDAPPLRAHLSPPTTVQDLTLYEFVE